MKLLREQLVLKDAETVSLTHTKVTDGTTTVLLVKGPLTLELADVLRCRNQCYNLNDNPYPSLKSLSLEHEISSCELSALGIGLQPTIVTGFTIRPDEAAQADARLELHFRLKFSTGAKALLDMFLQASGKFDLSLRALQRNLFDAAPSGKEGDGPEGGTKVDMTDKPEEEKPGPKKVTKATKAT
jgi:hypothetical protein